MQSAGFAPVCVCDLGMAIPTQQKGDNRSYHQLCWAHMQELLLLAIASIFHRLHREKKEMAFLLSWDRQSLKFAEGT